MFLGLDRRASLVAGPPPVAGCIAWYVCAMGHVRARSLTEQGYGAEVEAIRAANPRRAAPPGPRASVVRR